MNATNIYISIVSFLVQLIPPVLCIIIYLKKKVKGLFFIAAGFIIQLLLLVFVPVIFLNLNLIFSQQIESYISMVGEVIFTIFFVYGVLLLVNHR
jgi:hypothetical protein